MLDALRPWNKSESFPKVKGAVDVEVGSLREANVVYSPAPVIFCSYVLAAHDSESSFVRFMLACADGRQAVICRGDSRCVCTHDIMLPRRSVHLRLQRASVMSVGLGPVFSIRTLPHLMPDCNGTSNSGLGEKSQYQSFRFGGCQSSSHAVTNSIISRCIFSISGGSAERSRKPYSS